MRVYINCPRDLYGDWAQKPCVLRSIISPHSHFPEQSLSSQQQAFLISSLNWLGKVPTNGKVSYDQT